MYASDIVLWNKGHGNHGAILQESKSEAGELDSMESNVRWKSEEQSHNEHHKKAYLLVVANVKFMFTRVLLSRLMST